MSLYNGSVTDIVLFSSVSTREVQREHHVSRAAASVLSLIAVDMTVKHLEVLLEPQQGRKREVRGGGW